jgi:hypothetical protein
VKTLGALGLTMMMSACTAPLPQYPSMEPAAAMEVMRAREGAVRSMMSTATVTVRDAEGSGISFDAAIVAQWPDNLRLRAWKFGSAAFDLTFTPEGLWVYVPEEARRRAGDRAEFEVSAEQFRRMWQLLGPNALQGATASETSSGLVAVRSMDSGGRVEFEIDSRTLTVRRCRFFDDEGIERATLTMESYRAFERDAIVWPMRIVASGGQGRFSIRMGTPEFNSELPAEAFSPPRRATKQPERATD